MCLLRLEGILKMFLAQGAFHYVILVFLRFGIRSLAGDCSWKLPLVLGLAPSSPRRNEETGATFFLSDS